ncbi:LysR family transcriptional regulator [Halomonas sp. HMF6819]|uniref:LysR family transcriptional regulator n=1 Tax=Halomonas sp. HMF6819 TaxID=3373085 RepID=UPI00379FD273
MPNEKTPAAAEKSAATAWVWDDTRAFLAVARHGTLSGAAGALGLGIATLSRRIERLESSLEVALFIRLQSGYRLTEAGTALVENAEAMEAAAAAIAFGAGQMRLPTGRVRLATAENLATELVLPALPELYRRYPGLTLELVTDITTVNLHRRDADLALRMVRPTRGNVTLRRLGTLGYGAYASAGYTARREASADFDEDAIIGWSEEYAHLPAAKWCEAVLKGRAPVLTTTSVATQVAAAQAGIGVAALPHLVAQRAGLACLSIDIDVAQPIYLVSQADIASSMRIRAVVDFLAELVSRHQERLSGRGVAR